MYQLYVVEKMIVVIKREFKNLKKDHLIIINVIYHIVELYLSNN
jgi:hypothetical protein